MAYLGNQPSNNFVSLKRQVITGNGGSSYTLDHSVASVNDVAIFVNNVRQDPATYSISGTALTLGGTISSSDSCYVIFLGQALQTVTPATGTVTNAMLGETITVAKGGTGLTSGFANGITMADMWRLTANLSTTGDSNIEITSNLERVDDASFGNIGTGMTESSGVFTFPSTGIYQVMNTASFFGGLDTTFSGVQILVTINNSDYDVTGNAYDSEHNGYFGNTVNFALVDVTNTSNVKVKFRARHQNNGRVQGSTSVTHTGFMFIRLGDT